MTVNRAAFATECVRQGVYFGTNPHYMLGVAQLRSGISDDSQADQIGPFRLKQADWDANCNDNEFDIHFLPTGINDWRRQCAVFGLMAHRAFDPFVLKNNRNPSAQELYLQQWPAAPVATLPADLQKALDDTAALIGPAAAAVLDDPQSAPPIINNPNQPDPGPAPIPEKKLGPLLGKLRDDNLQRWQRMQIDPNLITSLDKVAARLVAPNAKNNYQAVTATTHVPWFVIAVIHEREASQSWAANIAQGDPWNTVSTHVPRNRGPFKSWNAAAVDALTNCPPRAAEWDDWTIGGALTLLEQYNGLGYAYHDRPSPYNWASTDQYVKGKFTSDGHYDPNAIDHQLGCAALLSRMKALDGSIAV